MFPAPVHRFFLIIFELENSDVKREEIEKEKKKKRIKEKKKKIKT